MAITGHHMWSRICVLAFMERSGLCPFIQPCLLPLLSYFLRLNSQSRGLGLRAPSIGFLASYGALLFWLTERWKEAISAHEFFPETFKIFRNSTLTWEHVHFSLPTPQGFPQSRNHSGGRAGAPPQVTILSSLLFPKFLLGLPLPWILAGVSTSAFSQLISGTPSSALPLRAPGLAVSSGSNSQLITAQSRQQGDGPIVQAPAPSQLACLKSASGVCGLCAWLAHEQEMSSLLGLRWGESLHLS